MTTTHCPFCPPPPDRVFHESRLTLALWDGFPVSPGHALVVPRRHVTGWFELTEDEEREVLEAIRASRTEIGRHHDPAGLNIGINDGEAAGQTVQHLHVHVIPRYSGDVEDPRGGVRWVLPGKAGYWDL